MALHDDLLAQARHLATKEPRRPRQASLRRAVSAAYYALFHRLIHDTVHFVVRGNGRDDLRDQLARVFEHGQMKEAARAFASAQAKNPWKTLLGGPPSVALRDVAQTFVDLQVWRHDADYTLARDFTRQEVEAVIAQATNAFAQWQTLRGSREAEIFCLALLMRTRG